MTPETHQKLDSHMRAIAQILYDDAQANGLPMDSLEDIEYSGGIMGLSQTGTNPFAQGSCQVQSVSREM